MNIYKVLTIFSEPSRLRIIAILDNGPLSVGAIAEVLELSQANCSIHLKRLYDCGVLIKNQVAQKVYYEINLEYKMQCQIYRPVIDTFKNHPDGIKDLKNLEKLRGQINE